MRWIDLPETKRAGHLFAEHKGNRGKRLLLIGHLDTVFEKDSPFQKFVREGNAAKGPGVADIKGGDVVMLFALRALRESGALDGASIVAAFTGDEENPGQPLEVARRDLIEAAKRSDVALEFENGLREGRTEWGTVARRSLGWWTLRTTGQMGHAQGIFGEAAGHDAVYEAARILWAFDQDLREQYLTYNAALFLAGTSVTEEGPDRGTAAGKGNVIPQKAVVHGDLRALTVEQIRKTQQKMREIVAKSLPRTSAQIEFTDVYPPMPPTAGNRALLDRLNQVNSDLGFATMDPIDPSKGAQDRRDTTNVYVVDAAELLRAGKAQARPLSRLAFNTGMVVCASGLAVGVVSLAGGHRGVRPVDMAAVVLGAVVFLIVNLLITNQLLYQLSYVGRGVTRALRRVRTSNSAPGYGQGDGAALQRKF